MQPRSESIDRTGKGPQSSSPGRCITCFRPGDLCFCDSIPSIDNRTEVLILQHRRERSHAFNSARIIRQSLRRCRLLADHTSRLAGRLAATELSDSAALLYPSQDAPLLTDLPANERPDQLVIVDGTWNHAKSLLRDLPKLRSLPRFRLAPKTPSRYRIRQEPNVEALSSLEATVAALRVLEPQTVGLEQLLAAFDRMIDIQIARLEEAPPSARRRYHRRSPVSNVPRSLAGDLSGLVVAYGEQHRGGPAYDQPNTARRPIYWTARRLLTEELFRCPIQSEIPLDDEFLARLRLSCDDLGSAVCVDQFRQSWQSFLRPGDTVAVYHPNTARMLRNVNAEFAPTVILKSIKFDQQCNQIPCCRGTLDDVLRSLGITSEFSGGTRAAERLAGAVALTRYVNSRCHQSTAAPISGPAISGPAADMLR